MNEDSGTCPECGEEYKSLGQHWRFNKKHLPPLSTHQREILAGLLMGDGCIANNPETPYLTTNMTSEKYLLYLDDAFGILSMGVRLIRNSEEQAKLTRESGFSPTAKEENYSDVYNWRTRCHYELETFKDWYSEDGKEIPEDIPLSPTVLKHWYTSDGHYRNRNGQREISICMSNEMNNKEKIEKAFERVGLHKPSRWSEWEREKGGSRCSAHWNVKETELLFEWMGRPLPGFEYKWPGDFNE